MLKNILEYDILIERRKKTQNTISNIEISTKIWVQNKIIKILKRSILTEIAISYFDR